MVCVLALSSVMVVSAEEQLERPQEWAEALGLTEMSGADAISHIGDENSVFLDLRAKEDFAAGHIKNTVSAPVCNADYSVPVSNRDAFVAQMAELKVVENKTTIYLSCYAGTFCVDFAADWLINNCGAEAAQLVRVTGGTFGDADLAAASTFVSTDYALAQVAAGGSVILDVRAADVYFTNGYLDGALHMPLFNYVDGANQVTDRQDALAQNFKGFVNANKAIFDNNKIYILCNSGASGAAAATALLAECGYTSNVFSIEGGAKAMFADHPELVVNQKFVSGAEAVAITGTATVPSATDANAVVIDVRAVERYDVGHLKSVPSYPLFTVDAENKNVVTNGYDKLAQDFLAKVAANADFFAGKDIYVVCNSGASGAKAATKLLMQAGYSNDVIYTITGGAKGTEEDMSVPQNSKFVSPAQAYRAQADLAYVILDVRAAEKYAAGTLEGAISLPLFTYDAANDKNIPVQAPYEDELSMAFKAYVEEYKDLFAEKTIYILCNSGESGARNATVLLNEAGLVDNVFSIDGGAKALVFDTPETDEPEAYDPVIDEPIVDDEPEADEPEADKPEIEIVDKDEEADAPKTGDTTPIMGYVLVMCAALAVIVNRKRFTK